MWRRTLPLFVVAAVVLAYLVGRRNGRASGPSSAVPSRIVSRPGKVLATFAGQTVTVDEFKAEWEAQNPFNRQRFSTPQGKREFLESLVRSELLAAEAARQGYDRDPRVLSEARKQMAARFVDEQFSEAALRKRMTDDEVRRFYEQHLEDYQRPERVRASLLLISVSGSDDGSREKRRGEANQLLTEIRQAESKDPMAFASAVRRRSDDAETRAVDGDLRFLTRQEMENRWGTAIAVAAFSLRQVGRISEVVEAPAGLALLKLENVDPGQRQTFEEAVATVRARAANEARTRDLDSFVDRLKREAGLFVDAAVLDSTSFDAPTPPARSAGSPDLIAGTAATTIVLPLPQNAPALQVGKR